MNAKQRYYETMLFGNPDKIPIFLGEPRESTLEEWRKQGLPGDTDYLDALFGSLGLSSEASLKREWIDVCFSMIPEYEPVILEHADGHYVLRDWMGAVVEISDRYDESYLRNPKDFVTRKWHKFPVENPEDWQEMKKRYRPESVGRFAADFTHRCDELKKRDAITSLSIHGVFWQLREWCGFENLCIMMMDNPGFIHEMADFWTEYVCAMLERILMSITPDCLYIEEDMAYKAHSMISPQMTREFIQPSYRRWGAAVRSNGCPLVEIDCDGYTGELIPIWVESGINCCSPVEVAAHCDVLDFRRKFGNSMAFVGGIDKRLISGGGRALEKYVMDRVPAMFKDGGYIPGCDHGVPPDISWPNFIEFGKLIARLSGWL